MATSSEKIPVKTCFKHVGGKLGLLLMDAFVAKGWITKDVTTDKHFLVTPKGEKEFAKLGIDLSQIKTEKI